MTKTSLAACEAQMAEALLLPSGTAVLEDDTNWSAFVEKANYTWLGSIVRDRLALYEELLLNSWEETLSSIYPHTQRFFPQTWLNIVDVYRREYPATHYQLYRLAERFPEFLEASDDSFVREARDTFSFLPQLAHYEWAEVAVQNLKPFELPQESILGVPKTVEALETQKPFWNPCAAFRVYDYALPEIIEKLLNLPDSEMDLSQNLQENAVFYPTPTMIYRKLNENKATFYVFNPLLAAFYTCSESLNSSYADVFRWLKANIASLETVSEAVLFEQGLAMLDNCYEKGLLLASITKN